MAQGLARWSCAEYGPLQAYPLVMAIPDLEAAMPEPVNVDTVIADMRARAEGWNSERYTMLSPEAAGALVAEFDRLRTVEAELESARHALDDDEALWRRMLPRLERWADDRNLRMAREHFMQAAEWQGVRAV